MRISYAHRFHNINIISDSSASATQKKIDESYPSAWVDELVLEGGLHLGGENRECQGLIAVVPQSKIAYKWHIGWKVG